MTMKMGLAGLLLVWLVYVGWMVSYYSSTFSLFQY